MADSSTNPETWEAWLALVRIHALRVAPNVQPAERDWIMSARLVYSAGSGAFGATHHRSWKDKGKTVVPVLSIEALVQEDAPQLAATMLHEMAHILAAFRNSGQLQGHNSVWQGCCADLGYILPSTYAKRESDASFAPETWRVLSAIPLPIASDGVTANPWQWSDNPNASPGTMTIVGATGDVYTRRFRCTDGDGVKGGKSRGTGSGSRWLSYDCPSCSRTIHASGTNRLIACGGVTDATHDPAIMVLRPSSLPPTRDAGFFVTLYPSPATRTRTRTLDTSGANAPLGSLASIRAMPIGEPPPLSLSDDDAFLAFFFATMMPEPPSFDALADRVLSAGLPHGLHPIGRVTWPMRWEGGKAVQTATPPTSDPLADLEDGPSSRVLTRPKAKAKAKRKMGGTSGQMKRKAKAKARAKR